VSLPTDTFTEGWPSADLEAVSNCPACGSTDRAVLHGELTDRVFGVAPGLWRMVRCTVCGAAYLDPRPTEESIGRAYTSYYTHEQGGTPAPELGGVRRLLLNSYLNDRWDYDLQPALPLGRLFEALVPLRTAIAAREIRHQHGEPGARLLDVGAGSGAFVAHARRLGWDAEGLDPDAAAVAVASEQQIPVRHGRLADLSRDDGMFDAVTMSHVIEHLHDPAKELRRIHALLRPGGRIWIATPNLEALGHRAFGKDWMPLDPPRHLVLFTRSCLHRLLGRTGFEPGRTPRPAPTAWQTFPQSAAIRAGQAAPLEIDPARARRSVRARAAVADRLSYVSSKYAEELVVTARRRDDPPPTPKLRRTLVG
jgi:SAM-dependent methyltransferase